jgi:hypothetical protein
MIQDSKPVFQHPQWMVGIVVILGLAALWAGFYNPFWWLIGFPCILTLLIYLFVRLKDAGQRSGKS